MRPSSENRVGLKPPEQILSPLTAVMMDQLSQKFNPNSVMSEALAIATHLHTQLSKFAMPIPWYSAPKQPAMAKTFSDRCFEWLQEGVIVPRAMIVMISLMAMIVSFYYGFKLLALYGEAAKGRCSRGT